MNPVGPPPPPFPPPPPPAFPVSAFGPPAQFQGQPYGYAGGYGYQAPADGKAVASLVLGILSLLGCGALLAIPAVILGVLARRDAERSGGRIGGAGLALGGIVTGVLLAVARIAGETAPLLFTALSNQFFSLDMSQPMANLPVTIFKFAMSPFAEWQSLAWAGVFLITLGVLGLNILARSVFSKK